MGQPLSALLWARQTCAWGPQIDAFDDRDVVGFSREGDPCHPGSGLCAFDRRARRRKADLYRANLAG